MAPRCPRRGELVWLDFDPQSGREQAGRRPALVLSSDAYNRKAGLAIFCPVTSRAKGYPFEVELPAGLAVEGVVLADHVKSFDWQARNCTLAGRVSDDVLEEVLGKLAAVLGMP